MKIYRAIIILFFAALIQISFVRLVSFSPFLPDLLLVALFLINYFQPFANILILSLVSGLFADLFSAVNFGASALAMTIVGAAMYLLREKFLMGKTFFGFAIISALAFSLFYLLLFVFNSTLGLIANNGLNLTAGTVVGLAARGMPADIVLILILYPYANPHNQT